MTKVRSLNGRGVAQFGEFLQQIRDGAEFHANPSLLYADDTTTRLPRAVEIEPRTFASKYEAAEYLARVLAEVPASADDVGLWSWLALYYFDQLSPLDSDGRRRPRENYHYIPSNQSGRRPRTQHRARGRL